MRINLPFVDAKYNCIYRLLLSIWRNGTPNAFVYDAVPFAWCGSLKRPLSLPWIRAINSQLAPDFCFHPSPESYRLYALHSTASTCVRLCSLPIQRIVTFMNLFWLPHERSSFFGSLSGPRGPPSMFRLLLLCECVCLRWDVLLQSFFGLVSQQYIYIFARIRCTKFAFRAAREPASKHIYYILSPFSSVPMYIHDEQSITKAKPHDCNPFGAIADRATKIA